MVILITSSELFLFPHSSFSVIIVHFLLAGATQYSAFDSRVCNTVLEVCRQPTSFQVFKCPPLDTTGSGAECRVRRNGQGDPTGL